jgi:nitroimidazol reductase NimA-like FMN-containing flavoprotein (pyridoxamine 5'-phosphate oxidase superfamily)
MNKQFKPKYNGNDQLRKKSADPDVAELIFKLLSKESFGVLSTQAEGKPYGSLVAFAFERDMKTFIFGTPTETRKYRNLQKCNRVALVVDSRAQVPGDVNRVEAVTITGRVIELKTGPTYDRLVRIYRVRYPYLQSFVDAKNTAFFAVYAEDFTFVTQFQRVYHWTPVAFR